MGVVAMLVISKINYKVFKAAAPYLLGLTLFYLCLFFLSHKYIIRSGRGFQTIYSRRKSIHFSALRYCKIYAYYNFGGLYKYVFKIHAHI